MLAFFNGNKLPLNTDFMPVIQGKSGEDLNNFKTNQIRSFQAAMTEVKNTHDPTDGNWFSIQVIMQDTNNGIMFAYSDSERIFFRIYTNYWHSWKEFWLK